VKLADHAGPDDSEFHIQEEKWRMLIL
jgi:hypothetical protein